MIHPLFDTPKFDLGNGEIVWSEENVYVTYNAEKYLCYKHIDIMLLSYAEEI